jgi:hypothetical protein
LTYIEVANPELTHVLPFRGYFCIDGYPLGTRVFIDERFGDETPIEKLLDEGENRLE